MPLCRPQSATACPTRLRAACGRALGGGPAGHRRRRQGAKTLGKPVQPRVCAAHATPIMGWSIDWCLARGTVSSQIHRIRYNQKISAYVPTILLSLGKRSSLNLSYLVARKIWRGHSVSPLCGRAHRLQRREPLRCLLVPMNTTFDLLQTTINYAIEFTRQPLTPPCTGSTIAVDPVLRVSRPRQAV